MDAQIGFADALRRASLMTLAKPLEFHGWICQETLCGRISVTFLNEVTGEVVPLAQPWRASLHNSNSVSGDALFGVCSTIQRVRSTQ